MNIEPKDSANTNSGTDFTSNQKAIDQAKNERIKSNQHTSKTPANKVSQKRNTTHKTNVSQKKTGGGKQLSTGD